MLHVEQTMQDLMVVKSPNGSADVGDLTPVVPTQLQSGKDGLLLFQNKRQELIDERCNNIPDHMTTINKTGYDQNFSRSSK